MIITSSQQLEERTNPSDALNMEEFEDITLKFGSFVCIAKGKKLNYLNLLKFLVDDCKTQKIYFNLLNEDNLQNIISAYLKSTPNVYKKIFRSKLNPKNKKIERIPTKNL
jgi:hypothetical protein